MPLLLLLFFLLLKYMLFFFAHCFLSCYDEQRCVYNERVWRMRHDVDGVSYFAAMSSLSIVSSQGDNTGRQCVVIPSYKRMFICDEDGGGGSFSGCTDDRDDDAAFSGRITDVTRRRFSLCGDRQPLKPSSTSRTFPRAHGHVRPSTRPPGRGHSPSGNANSAWTHPAGWSNHHED